MSYFFSIACNTIFSSLVFFKCIELLKLGNLEVEVYKFTQHTKLDFPSFGTLQMNGIISQNS